MTDNTRLEVSLSPEGRRILRLEIDLDVNFGLTASGKAILTASSEGWLPLPGAENCALNFTVTQKRNGGDYRAHR